MTIEMDALCKLWGHAQDGRHVRHCANPHCPGRVGPDLALSRAPDVTDELQLADLPDHTDVTDELESVDT